MVVVVEGVLTVGVGARWACSVRVARRGEGREHVPRAHVVVKRADLRVRRRRAARMNNCVRSE